MKSREGKYAMKRMDQREWNRRAFLGAMGAISVSTSGWMTGETPPASAASMFKRSPCPHTQNNLPEPGERPPAPPQGVRVVNPKGRVPVSLIIDDSTPLVNLAHFAIPQFAEVFPDNYRQNWRVLPREIPDAFVREFIEFGRSHGVRGKYSVVPYPACVGWVDRDFPGWTRRELEASLALIRDEIAPDWDIHPEMISHTWAIDVKTGRPYPERTADFQENWGFSVGKDATFLTEYLAYALKILKNVGFLCQGITTPGGFGNRVLRDLSLASRDAVGSLFPQVDVAHYVRHLYTDDRSVAPRVEFAEGLNGPSPRCVVSIIGCTGDWFGGWDGLEIGSADRFLTPDGQSGRLAEVIARGEPAVMVSHWPGMYCNGSKEGFAILQAVVERLEASYRDRIIWMNLDGIAHAWAARVLTAIRLHPLEAPQEGQSSLELDAPFPCDAFTLEWDRTAWNPPRDRPLMVRTPDNRMIRLEPITRPERLEPGCVLADEPRECLIACFDLPRGRSRIEAGSL